MTIHEEIIRQVFEMSDLHITEHAIDKYLSDPNFQNQFLNIWDARMMSGQPTVNPFDEGDVLDGVSSFLGAVVDLFN